MSHAFFADLVFRSPLTFARTNVSFHNRPDSFEQLLFDRLAQLWFHDFEFFTNGCLQGDPRAAGGFADSDQEYLILINHQEDQRITPQFDALVRVSRVGIDERSKLAWNLTLSSGTARSRALPWGCGSIVHGALAPILWLFHFQYLGRRFV
jgi:hypothetical protein